MFLQLDTEMSNFSKNEDSISWEFSNLVLPSGGLLSLQAMVLDFDSKFEKCTTVCLNLIEQNMFNPDGTIFALHGGKGQRYIHKYTQTPGQWKLDSMYPRYVTFKFNNVNIDTLNFAAFTLMIN